VTADYVPDDTVNYTTLTGISAGNFTINPAGLTITANSTNKVYGQSFVFAGTEFTASTLYNGDSVTSVSLSSAGATNTAAVNTYPILATNAVGSGLANYNISYVNGTLTVTAAPANSITSIKANPNGSRTLTFTGEIGFTYRIQAATNISAPVWIDISTNTIGGTGSATFTDTDSVGQSEKFYRTVYP
jgi:hypothetical protein